MHRVEQLQNQLSTTQIHSNNTMSTQTATLSQYLQSINTSQSLQSVIHTVTDSAVHIAVRLQQPTAVQQANTENTFGDKQLNIDIDTDKIVFDTLRSNKHIATASSEETPTVVTLNSNSDTVYSVTFDPLDGSSIIDANITVGSIYAIFTGSQITNITGRTHCVCSIIAVYGPHTGIYIGIQQNHTKYCIECIYDYTNKQWIVVRTDITLSNKSKYFAPANLRAAAESHEYNKLVNYYITNKYTLRYTGGLVPDIAHILTKNQGVFISPVTKQSKAKLRLLYEVISIAYLVECANGQAVDQSGQNILDIDVSNTDVRTGLICGSSDEVIRFKQYYNI